MYLPRIFNFPHLLPPLILTGILYLWFNPSQAQDPMLNTLDLYSPQALVTCKFTTMDQGDFFWIYAQLEFEQPVEDSLWIGYYWETAGILYQDSVMFSAPDRRQLRLKWEFKASEVPIVVTVNFSWKARSWLFQEHFPMNAINPDGGISFWDSSIPWFQDWARTTDSLRIENNASNRTFVYYYSHQFEPSRPPMAMKPGAGDATLTIDSVFTLPPGYYFAPKAAGLYLFQSDSSSTAGRSLLVTSNNFPEPQKISELTEPLIYLTTREEFRQLKDDLSNKQSLDKFWLSTLGSQDKARTAIKQYYQNIEISNTLFTSYKEGWKTDRGLIYAVMGKPLTVTKMTDGEVWTYQDVAGDVLSFSFLKIRNIFSNNHYELVRDKSYDRDWFQAIDKWREGRIN